MGEALCRLFPPDENIDLRRIAQIARQSLKQSSGKVSSSGSRSVSDVSVPPAASGMTESSSSRSDILLLGLVVTFARTAVGVLCWAVWTRLSRTVCLRGTRACTAAKNLQMRRTNVAVTMPDFGSKSGLLKATLPQTLKRTQPVNPGDGLWCCRNCNRGGLFERTAVLFRGHFACFTDQLNGWLKDFLSEIPLRTFLPSWTLPAVL